MEQIEKKSLIKNVSISRNPITTAAGLLTFIIAFAMAGIKYLLPYFLVLLKPVEYEWYHILGVAIAGLFFVFVNEEYFRKVFNRVDKYSAKVTGTAELDKKESE